MGITIPLEETCTCLQRGASVIFISRHHHRHSRSYFLAFNISILKSYSATNIPLWRVLLANIGIYTANKLSSIFSMWWSNLFPLNDTLWWLYSACFAMDYFYYAQLHQQANANIRSSLLVNALINEDCYHVSADKPRHFYCHAP